MTNLQRKLEENFSARERKGLSFRYPQRKETLAGGSTFTRRPFCMGSVQQWRKFSLEGGFRGRVDPSGAPVSDLIGCCFFGLRGFKLRPRGQRLIAEPLKEPEDIDEIEFSNVDGACPLHHCDSPGGSETRCNTHRGQPCMRETYCKHVDRGLLFVIVCGEDKT